MSDLAKYAVLKRDLLNDGISEGKITALEQLSAAVKGQEEDIQSLANIINKENIVEIETDAGSILNKNNDFFFKENSYGMGMSVKYIRFNNGVVLERNNGGTWYLNADDFTGFYKLSLDELHSIMSNELVTYEDFQTEDSEYMSGSFIYLLDDLVGTIYRYGGR